MKLTMGSIVAATIRKLPMKIPSGTAISEDRKNPVWIS